MHFIVFIWGFTGLLGGLISVDALTLVWIRVGLALGVLVVYGAATGQLNGVARWADRGWLALGGWIIAGHWVTFFHAIKIANISVALACLSTGAFFAALLEPLVFRRRFSPREGLLGAGVGQAGIECLQIAVYVGQQRQLHGVSGLDVFSPSCPSRLTPTLQRRRTLPNSYSESMCPMRGSPRPCSTCR